MMMTQTTLETIKLQKHSPIKSTVENSNPLYIHALKSLSDEFKLGIGDQSIQKFQLAFTCLAKLFNFKDPADGLSLLDLPSTDISKLKKLRSISLDQINHTLKQSQSKLEHYQTMGIKFSSFYCSDYPSCLRDLSNPPSIIYYYGDLSKFNFKRNISIVGTRNASLYGKHSTRALVQSLEEVDVAIVSGLARGIDTEAHLSALEKQIPTIAVLGAGLLKASQTGNDNLIRHIYQAKHGENLVLSEFEPMQNAEQWTFPQRNRIIAALSRATIIIEAAEKSGALITANFAKDLSRTVYALAAEISDKKFQGNHNFLAENKAKPIFSIKQIEQDLELQRSERLSILRSQKNPENNKPKSQLNAICNKILEQIDADPISFDSLLAKVKLNQITLSVSLSILEIQGYINKYPGPCFAKTKAAH